MPPAKAMKRRRFPPRCKPPIDAAGGLDRVTPGMRVALKLNLVSAMKPEEAATVHPAVVCALVRMLQARGAHVVLGRAAPAGCTTPRICSASTT